MEVAHCPSSMTEARSGLASCSLASRKVDGLSRLSESRAAVAKVVLGSVAWRRSSVGGTVLYIIFIVDFLICQTSSFQPLSWLLAACRYDIPVVDMARQSFR
jgi:hypothetical protein